MNRGVERSPNTMVVGERAYAHDGAARVVPRIQRWFGRRDRERLNREMNLRMEERLKERARIARDLHDTLFQGFLGASLQIHHAVEQVPADSPIKPSLSRALRLMQRVIDEGRGALSGLRSSATESMSLEQALSCLRDEFAPGCGVPFRVFVKGESKTLKPAVHEQLYLIGREALFNAVRHSEATSIEAEVEYLPRRLSVVVRDNGCGIDPQIVRSGWVGRLGILGMRERAGSIGAQLRIWSSTGAGTEVEISVPGGIMAETHA
jgi:signal transduction histidine kinase